MVKQAKSPKPLGSKSPSKPPKTTGGNMNVSSPSVASPGEVKNEVTILPSGITRIDY